MQFPLERVSRMMKSCHIEALRQSVDETRGLWYSMHLLIAVHGETSTPNRSTKHSDCTQVGYEYFVSKFGGIASYFPYWVCKITPTAHSWYL
jgi:hypothetical protein